MFNGYADLPPSPQQLFFMGRGGQLLIERSGSFLAVLVCGAASAEM